MTLSSMTGFARAAGQWEDYRWTWEIKSVNGRNLDVRCRMPSGFEAVEQMVRKSLKNMIARGSVNVNLQLSRDSSHTTFRVNQDMLDVLVEVAIETAMENHLPQPSLDALMAIRDVIEYVETEEDEQTVKTRNQALKTSFDAVLNDFKAARETEGGAIQAVLTGFVDEIERLVKQADGLSREMPELIRSRYMDKVSALLDDTTIAPERLAQEVVLLATKADVREEIDRLYAHVTAARAHITADGQVGRKLDFLTQEFNREANTLCSKAPDIQLTNVGLSLKTAIDQFREQVQNIE